MMSAEVSLKISQKLCRTLKQCLNYERTLGNVKKNDNKNCFFSINVKGDIVLVKTFLSRLVKLFFAPAQMEPRSTEIKDN